MRASARAIDRIGSVVRRSSMRSSCASTSTACPAARCKRMTPARAAISVEGSSVPCALSIALSKSARAPRSSPCSSRRRPRSRRKVASTTLSVARGSTPRVVTRCPPFVPDGSCRVCRTGRTKRPRCRHRVLRFAESGPTSGGAAAARRRRNHRAGLRRMSVATAIATAGLNRSVARVAPLAAAVDADLLDSDDGLAHADRHGEVRQRLLPEPVVLATAAEENASSTTGSAVRLERLGLSNGGVAVAKRRERDPGRECVAFRRHEREGFAVGIDDHDSGRHLYG